jgi:hypothetical protein
MEIGTIIEIDFSNLEDNFYDGDYYSYDDFGELIDRYEGSVELDQWLAYNISDEDNEIILNINYYLEVRGYYDYCPGDYWTPPDCSLEITETKVSIVDFTINDEMVDLDMDLEEQLTIVVEKKIGV